MSDETYPAENLSQTEIGALHDYVRRMRRKNPDDPETAVLQTWRDEDNRLQNRPVTPSEDD